MEQDKNRELWEKCVAFHGHACGGLTIGYKAALCAIQALGLTFSGDEEVVCISENDACGVDAIQVILGCSAGKGNLLFHITGKQAFSIYDRTSGRSVRLLLRPKPREMSREESFAYYQGLEPEEMFETMPTRLQLPEPARIFQSLPCDGCGEITAEHLMRLENGRKLCLDCYHHYNRFRV